MLNKFKVCFSLKIIIPVILVSLLYSCRKEEIAIQYSLIDINTTADLFKIKKYDGHTFYLCGGVGNSGLILSSTDSGKTWLTIRDDFPGKIFDIDFIDDQKMVAVSQLITFYRTTDGWLNWQYITPPAGEYPLTGYDSNLYSIKMLSDSDGISCGGKEYQHGVIYRTTDGGITWRYTYKQHEMKSVLRVNSLCAYAAGYGVIYRTNDAGLNWNITDAKNDYFTALAIAEPDHVFAAGYQGSIIDNYDAGNNWTCRNNSNKPFEKRVHFNCLDFFNSATGVAAGMNGIIYVTRDGGNNWQAGSAFDASQINSIALTGDHSGIAAGEKGKLYRFQF